jgi:hypothetical protein
VLPYLVAARPHPPLPPDPCFRTTLHQALPRRAGPTLQPHNPLPPCTTLQGTLDDFKNDFRSKIRDGKAAVLTIDELINERLDEYLVSLSADNLDEVRGVVFFPGGSRVILFVYTRLCAMCTQGGLWRAARPNRYALLHFPLSSEGVGGGGVVAWPATTGVPGPGWEKLAWGAI